MSNKTFGTMNGKGYYIALILCAAAIGISGYLYHLNNKTPEPKAYVPAPTQPGSLEAVATKPQPTAPVPHKPAKPRLRTAAPVSGEPVNGYAAECLSYNATTRDWRTHEGVDYTAQSGTKVGAAADGTVYTVYEDDTMGTTVVIRHEGGYVTKYASLAEEVLVQPGDRVKLGQAVGCVGTTALLESELGDHVHFAVTRDNKSMDPMEFLSQE